MNELFRKVLNLFGPVGIGGVKGFEITEGETIKQERKHCRGETVSKDCIVVTTINLERIGNVVSLGFDQDCVDAFHDLRNLQQIKIIPLFPYHNGRVIRSCNV